MRVVVEGVICEMRDDRQGLPMVKVETTDGNFVKIPMSRDQVLQFKYAQFVCIILESTGIGFTVTKEQGENNE